MNPIVLDASLFIDHLKGKTTNFELLIEAVRKMDSRLFIPTAVLVEIFVGYEFIRKDKREKAEALLQDFHPVELTENIAQSTAEIGRRYKLGFLGTVDLVVAATTLELDAELATHNIKHFKLIPKLKLLDFQKLSVNL